MESVLAVLSREQCLRLMATAPVGRIIYTRHAMPAVEVVNFTVDAGDIVIRTAPSGKLLAAIRGAVVAFEADDFDPVTRSGWSVTAVGHAREVTNPADIGMLRTTGPHPWVAGDHPYFVRITPGQLTGRYLSAAAGGPAGPGGGAPPPAR
jgi:nitroimidazol reductase NimA-like FMN-containing flavoprotein (pyridoxamine 5'-phosphate oxidase superfamily)